MKKVLTWVLVLLVVGVGVTIFLRWDTIKQHAQHYDETNSPILVFISSFIDSFTRSLPVETVITPRPSGDVIG